MNAAKRTAVVSGGSSGIGRALVSQLHQSGWNVWACGRDPAKLDRLAKDFPGVSTFACDVADRAAVRSFAEKVAASHTAIDLLVSNAGGLKEIDFSQSDLSGVDLTSELRINTEGAIHLIAEFMPALRKTGQSNILVVSSGYALAPAKRAPVYSASKAALHSLCKSLRRQLAPLGIGVTELLPPVVDTPAVSHRQVKKVSAESVAGMALSATFSGQHEVCPGQVRMLPLLLRIAPGLADEVVSKT